MAELPGLVPSDESTCLEASTVADDPFFRQLREDLERHQRELQSRMSQVLHSHLENTQFSLADFRRRQILKSASPGVLHLEHTSVTHRALSPPFTGGSVCTESFPATIYGEAELAQPDARETSPQRASLQPSMESGRVALDAFKEQFVSSRVGRQTMQGAEFLAHGAEVTHHAVSALPMNLIPQKRHSILRPHNEALRRTKKSKLQRLVLNRGYDAVNSLAITLCALFLIVEMEVRSKAVENASEVPTDNTVNLHVFRLLLSLYFCADLCVRFAAFGLTLFSDLWNCFDVLVCLASFGEAVATLSTGVPSIYTGDIYRMLASNVNMLRILFLLRVMLDCNLLKGKFRELRIIVFALLGALTSLLWCLVVMMIMLFVFGVFFTEGTIGYCIRHNKLQHESTEMMRYYFGTLSYSVASLFQATTGGEDWGNLKNSIDALGHFYIVMFYFYILFALFTLTNIVAAVVIESTMSRSKNDSIFGIEHEVREKTSFTDRMHQVFEELDRDSSGVITLTELQNHMCEPNIAAYFRAIGLNVKEVSKMFSLLDEDGSGGIDREEFTEGCLRLKGEAKNLDVAIVRYELQELKQVMLALGARLGDRQSTMTLRQAGRSCDLYDLCSNS